MIHPPTKKKRKKKKMRVRLRKVIVTSGCLPKCCMFNQVISREMVREELLIVTISSITFATKSVVPGLWPIVYLMIWIKRKVTRLRVIDIVDGNRNIQNQ